MEKRLLCAGKGFRQQKSMYFVGLVLVVIWFLFFESAPKMAGVGAIRAADQAIEKLIHIYIYIYIYVSIYIYIHIFVEKVGIP